MWETIKELTPSEWAAWYAAVVATTALVWEIIKYVREGFKIEIQVKANMVLAGQGHPDHGKKFVSINVRHLSGPPTTITHVGYWQFSSFWHKLFSHDAPRWFRRLLKTKSVDGGVFIADDFCSHPHKLEVGTEWNCHIEQGKLPAVGKKGRLYIVIAHTLGKENIWKKLDLTPRT